MTKHQKEIVETQLILLDKKDIKTITGWCDNVINNIFAYDKDFPAIKKGKRYQVELTAFKEYLSKRRVNESE